jgi:DnaJ-class molecular chaperone
MDQETLDHALKVFEISEPLPVAELHERYRKLLWMWHPHRYANLTNNPQKYMKMYKKGEAKTKEVHAAFEILKDWLEKSNDQPPSTSGNSPESEAQN